MQNTDIVREVKILVEGVITTTIPEALQKARSEADFEDIQKQCEFVIGLLLHSLRGFLMSPSAAGPDDYYGFLEAIRDNLCRQRPTEANVNILVGLLRSLYSYVLIKSFHPAQGK
jgi:hypothetical protein